MLCQAQALIVHKPALLRSSGSGVEDQFLPLPVHCVRYRALPMRDVKLLRSFPAMLSRIAEKRWRICILSWGVRWMRHDGVGRQFIGRTAEGRTEFRGVASELGRFEALGSL